MKKLLLPLLALAACTSKPTYTPTQEKIIKLAQHLAPDSAHYVPLKFGKPRPFTNLDSVDEQRFSYNSTMEALYERVRTTTELADLAAANHAPAAEVKDYKREADEARDLLHKASSRQSNALRHSTHAIIGQRINHIWRVGEQIESADFVVYTSGQVQRLKPAASSL